LAERLPRSILLAEDHPINQRVALGALRKLGYEPDLAQDGRAVLAALERRRYDIILMDVQMPELDGLEAAQAVRQRCSAEDPWIIALTANASVEDRHRCLQSGMNDYLSKPLRVRELVAALERSPGGAGAAKETASYPASRLSDVGLLDRETLEELRGLELLPELIRLFAEQAPPLVEGIHAASASADYQELAQLAHRLKGASATVGAAALSSLAHAIEAEAGATSPVVAIGELRGLMMRSLDRLQHEQHRETSTLSGTGTRSTGQ
jgi:CheY-like chemotaxis protein